MKKSPLAFLKDQFTKLPPVATADLSGKTVVVTGANVGLGFQAAKHFASMKPGRLILGCRNEEKGKAAVDRIKAETGFDAVELWLLDLAKFSSVIAFADRLEKEAGRLDILLANAAIIPSKYKLTGDGWEESLQVNDLSTSLLCLLVAPLAVETARKYGGRPRITIVSSDVHFWAKDLPPQTWDAESSFQYLNSPEYCNPAHIDRRYMETKLLNVFFTRSFAELLKNTPVIVDTVNPGLCSSELMRDAKGIRAVAMWIFLAIFARTTEQGARQLVYAAVANAENPEALHGQYINIHKVEEMSDYVIEEAGKARQDKLWNDLIRELSKVDSRVGEIVQQYK